MQKQMKGIHRALRYAFPPNQLKYCGPKLDVEEYKLLFDDIKRAEEFLMSLPFLGKRCAQIAMQMNIDTFDSRVINAYFLGIHPYKEKNRPLTHLMDLLLTDGMCISKTKNEKMRSSFIARLNKCSIRCGTVLSVRDHHIVANLSTFTFFENKINYTYSNEAIFPLPFDNFLLKCGEAVATHGLYVIESISHKQLKIINEEMQKEIQLFNSLIINNNKQLL